MGIVDQLDIRRLQVLVEAIIVEVVADRTSELGVTWATDGSNNDNIVGATNFPDLGPGPGPRVGPAPGPQSGPGPVDLDVDLVLHQILDLKLIFGLP